MLKLYTDNIGPFYDNNIGGAIKVLVCDHVLFATSDGVLNECPC
jgi:hypothetical protein